MDCYETRTPFPPGINIWFVSGHLIWIRKNTCYRRYKCTHNTLLIKKKVALLRSDTIETESVLHMSMVPSFEVRFDSNDQLWQVMDTFTMATTITSVEEHISAKKKKVHWGQGWCWEHAHHLTSVQCTTWKCATHGDRRHSRHTPCVKYLEKTMSVCVVIWDYIN